ncbi:MAG TPA: hypothetical protein VGP24_10050 [Glaciihabitans sp.]|nr:hypothetical protein [Glaciihabitans sp.]
MTATAAIAAMSGSMRRRGGGCTPPVDKAVRDDATILIPPRRMSNVL